MKVMVESSHCQLGNYPTLCGHDQLLLSSAAGSQFLAAIQQPLPPVYQHLEPQHVDIVIQLEIIVETSQWFVSTGGIRLRSTA